MEHEPSQRDFLNEAFVLFETRGQNTLDEPVVEREYSQTFPNQLGQDAALTMVRDEASVEVQGSHNRLTVCAFAILLEGSSCWPDWAVHILMVKKKYLFVLQGTVMRDPKVYSLYQPNFAVPPMAAQGAVGLRVGISAERSEGSAIHPREPSSNSGSDGDWEPEIPALRSRSSHENGKLGVRERGKPIQRKWRQKYKVGIPPRIPRL